MLVSTWMFSNQKSMKKVNKIQERYLRLMANNYELGYEGLPDSTNEIFPVVKFCNDRNIQTPKWTFT